MSSDATAALPRRGLMLIIASPSGAGKSTLSRLLLQADPNLRLSVSVTTRPRRQSEVEGVHYHFISRETYDRMRRDGDLLESAEVHGNFYGTPKGRVEAELAAGRDILFDIDYQGTLQLYETMRADIVSVFVLPPSIADLRQRLERRAEDKPEVIERRLQTALVELSQWRNFDHVIVNDDLDRSFLRLRSILEANRCERRRMTGLEAFATGLESELKAMAGCTTGLND
jgi:guanylate kinase